MSKEFATFAAGCFWGVEKAFKKKFPSITTKVGYCGGTVTNPTYEQTCSGKTGHAEAIQIAYDPSTITYPVLVDFFFRMHDPTTLDKQGNDKGSQYRSAIFYNSPEQKIIAQDIMTKVKGNFKWGIKTSLEELKEFYDAEQYHQNYLFHNPHGYECPTHFERTWDQIKKSQFE